MKGVWSIIAKDKNRQIISWMGGALAAVVVAAWTVVTYVWPTHDPASPKIICAQQGSIVGGRDVSNNTINYAGGPQSNTANGSVSCAAADKK
jgi:hypothetical protein